MRQPSMTRTTSNSSCYTTGFFLRMRLISQPDFLHSPHLTKMANRVCKPCRELLRQHFGLLREFNPAAAHPQASLVAAARISRRQLHQSTSRSEGRSTKGYTLPQGVNSVAELASSVKSTVATKTFGSYVIYGATEKLYEVCSKRATYTISQHLRKEDKIPLTKDGEEIGVGGGIWHDRMFAPFPRDLLARRN